MGFLEFWSSSPVHLLLQTFLSPPPPPCSVHTALLSGAGARRCVSFVLSRAGTFVPLNTHTHAHTRVYGLEAQVWIDTGHPPCVLGTEERVSGSLCVTLGRASVTRGRGARRRSECYVGLEQRVFLTSNCSQ